MKLFKKLITILAIMLLVFFAFLLWYQQRYSMDVVTPGEINTSIPQPRLLVATQGSDFKNAVTNGIVDHFAADSVYIKIIDVSLLDHIDPSGYNALVILHTWENWKAPRAVANFIAQIGAHEHKLVVLTTSGEGSYTIAGIDALVGESKLADAEAFSDSVIRRVEPLLKQNLLDVYD